jgi:hypothetical protein
MNIINFKEFAAMPEGTIYSYFKPAIVDGLCRKGENIISEGEVIDYFTTSLIADVQVEEPPKNKGDEWNIENGLCGRWALYEYDQQYLIYEAEDIKAITFLLDA